MNGPCKGCPDRHVGCHGKCEKYSDYRKKVDEYNEKRRLEEVGKFCPVESVLRHHKQIGKKEKEK